MNASTIGLIILVVVLPIVGFALTVVHARAGEDFREQRRRKRHGLFYWTLLPGIAGLLTLLGLLEILPSGFMIAGVGILGASALISWIIQNR